MAALSGIKVLDFGIYAAGPICSVVLGDLGADIIRVEPVGGEPLRGFFRGYNGVNRGKRVIALNLKAPEAARIVERLTAAADVVHYNYRPGVAARMGIDAATLRTRKPDTIVLEAPGYGVTGPKANQPAFDMVLQGFAGHETRLGGQGKMPLWCRLAFVDVAAGLLGANAILTMLYRRARTGQGGEVHVSLLDTAIYLMSELIRAPDGTFLGTDILDTERRGSRPARSIYQAKDGWIALAVYGAEAAKRFAAALSIQIGADPELWDDAERSEIGRAVRNRECAALTHQMRLAGIWAEIYREAGGSELLHNEALRGIGAILTGSHPRYGRTAQPGQFVHLSRAGPAADIRSYIAEPGGNTRDILSEYNYSEAEIDDLYRQRVVA